ncbi:hypothetical protein BJX68DRAFT_224800 [Aspergillus pseudodeflectus]|uniref:C2H2-type domain-containing protein n=1 Tax=Aspergillus pseudodeflectus TaxID=176178 RepID=A0ABR4L9Y9_9EURO
MDFPFPPGSAQRNANDENFPLASEIDDGAGIWSPWPYLNGDPQQQQRPLPYQHPGQFPQPQHFSEFLSVGPGMSSLRVPSAMTRENSHMSTMSAVSGLASLDSQSPYHQPEILGQARSDIPHNSFPFNTSFGASIPSQDLRARLNKILEDTSPFHDTILVSSGLDQQLLRLFDEGASILRKLTQPDVGQESALKRQDSQTKKHRCIVCGSTQTYKSRGTVKRHLLVHFPEIEFHCGFCPKPAAPEAWQYRRDKFYGHMANKHGKRISNADAYIQTQRVPSECPLSTCRAAIASWEEFWKHFCQHCEIPEEEEDQAQGRGGGGHGNGDRNNGRGGHQFQPSPNNGDFGSSFGNIQPDYHGGNGGSGNGGMGCGDGSHWGYACNTADSSSTPADLLNSPQSPEPEGSSVPALTFRPRPLSIRKGQERRHMSTDTAPETARPTEASKKLGNISPRAELDQDRDDSPVKETDDGESVCGSCKHTISGCSRCAQFVAAPIKCHQCADRSCEKAHTGSNAAGIRLSGMPGCSFPWGITRQDGGKNPITFSNAEFTKARKVVSKCSASLTDDIEFTEISEMVFSLQIHDSNIKRGTGTSEEDPASLQEVESPTDTDFPPGLYFERYLYTTQSQGSFLQYVHETLIFPEPHRFIVSSFQGVYSFNTLCLVILFGT